MIDATERAGRVLDAIEAARAARQAVKDLDHSCAELRRVGWRPEGVASEDRKHLAAIVAQNAALANLDDALSAYVPNTDFDRDPGPDA